MKRLKLPIGKEFFREIREEGSYYIDKTKMIEEIAEDNFKVILFTRPRRFGKTLMMQTLSDFFDIRRDNSALFEGLYISGNKELCGRQMNKYPVLSLTFKDVDGFDFDTAYERFCRLIAVWCEENICLEQSSKLPEEGRKVLKSYRLKTAKKADMNDCLFHILRMLNIYYGKTAMLILDEYDVPLAKADEKGYYREMVDFIRGLFSKSIKSNPYLEKGIITGCLRIAHESIFTGANNFKCNTISDKEYSEYFGFTQAEVDKLLKDADGEEYGDELKKWYDGYIFGGTEMYCPWDVINCVSDLYHDPNAARKCYWKNTSRNSIIRRFIERASPNTKRKLEMLMNGKYITTQTVEDMSYDILNSSEENVWSIMYLTGYLTMAKEQPQDSDMINLVIPNNEVKKIYEETIAKWFNNRMRNTDNSDIFNAFEEGDTELLSLRLSKLLTRTISYYDYKEDYYHAFLVGILIGGGYDAESNREHGEGRPDILIRDIENGKLTVVEIKRAKSRNDLEAAAQSALEQIDRQRYAEEFEDEYPNIICYGAAFYKKSCFVAG